MTVREAKPKDLIQVEYDGIVDIGSDYYLITTYQDCPSKVRAYRSIGGGLVYLHPGNNCRVINQKELI
jgi:hypothetical protein